MALYGPTHLVGDTKNCGSGCGTVFKLAPDGTETALRAFNRTSGGNPAAGLLKGANGLLYGTTVGGGTYHDGVVFSAKK